MSNTNTSLENTKLSALIASNANNEHNLSYYRNHLITNGNIYEAIQTRIKTGFIKTKVLVLGFIPIVTKQLLDNLDVQRLELEMIEIDHVVYNYKKHVEMWSDIQKREAMELDEATRENNNATMKKV